MKTTETSKKSRITKRNRTGGTLPTKDGKSGIRSTAAPLGKLVSYRRISLAPTAPAFIISKRTSPHAERDIWGKLKYYYYLLVFIRNTSTPFYFLDFFDDFDFLCFLDFFLLSDLSSL